jgi:hypothetical protein
MSAISTQSVKICFSEQLELHIIHSGRSLLFNRYLFVGIKVYHVSYNICLIPPAPHCDLTVRTRRIYFVQFVNLHSEDAMNFKARSIALDSALKIELADSNR